MCKEKILMWLSGAAALDALVHLSIGAFGRSWFNVSATTNLILFVVFGLLAVVFGYLGVILSRR